MATSKEQIAPEIVQAIVSLAAARGVSVNDYLRQVLGLAKDAQSTKQPIEELFDELSGVVDSRVPNSSSPPRPTVFGSLLAEEFKKHGLKLS